MIRTDAGCSVSRFSELLGVPRRTYHARLARHRAGDPPKGPWPAPVVDRIEPTVAKYENVVWVSPYAVDWPAWGYRKIRAIVAVDGPAMKSVATARWFAARPHLSHVRTRHRSPHTNGVVERWFESLKYERLYREDIASGLELADCVADFINEYNTIRLWVPIIRSWALTRGFALHPGTSCVASFTGSSRCWHGLRCVAGARRTSSTNTEELPDQPRQGFGHPHALLRRYYLLFFIDITNREVLYGGITTNPTGAWTTQAARNLFVRYPNRFTHTRALVRDRASQFVNDFDEIFRSEGLKILRTPVRVPVANAFAERWIGTLRRELLDRTIIWNQRQLERLVIDYIDHYNIHRPHRSLDQRPPRHTTPDNNTTGHPLPLRLVRTTRCDGLINEYKHAA